MAQDPLSLLLHKAEKHNADQKRAAQQQRTLAAQEEQAKPLALVLVVNILKCECGEVYRMPNASALLRYRGAANTVHFSQNSVRQYLHLPRELREHEYHVPFCEKCFGVAGVAVSGQLERPAGEPEILVDGSLSPATPKRFAGQVKL